MNIRKNIDYTQLYAAIDSAMEAAEKSRWNCTVKSEKLCANGVRKARQLPQPLI